MVTIKQIQSKKVWDTFLEKTYSGFFPFFQTWNWGEVQQRLGFQIERIGMYEEDKLVGVALLIYVHAKRGAYIHLRHGPVLLHTNKPILTALLKYLRKRATEEECAFIRVSPLLPLQDKSIALYDSLGFRDAPIHNMDAEVCWVLDITQSEEMLLAEMRKSHRYLIKKALKEPVEILAIDSLNKDVLEFLGIYTKLASKRGFVPHKGLVEEIEILGKDKEALLLLAKYEGKIIGGALIDFAGPMAIYHHGATDDAYRQVSVSYLLQWYAIQEAKKRGKKLYNFWGIAPNESKKHPWYGLTLFKTGFGGEKKEFMHAKDLPLSPWYLKTYLIEILSKIRKGY